MTGLERPLGLQEVEAPRIPRQSAHKSSQVCKPYAPVAFTPRRYLWYLFLLKAESTPVQPEGLSQRKIPTIPSGIETTTFLLVAQCLNLNWAVQINPKKHDNSSRFDVGTFNTQQYLFSL